MCEGASRPERAPPCVCKGPMPVLRRPAVLQYDEAAAFPALQRLALAAPTSALAAAAFIFDHSALCARFAAW